MFKIKAVFFSALLLAISLASCKKETETWKDMLPELRSDSTLLCQEYLFDSALANLLYLTDVMLQAESIEIYAAPDTNTFGWTQERYVVFYRSTHASPKPIDVVYLHGGGADVGHAGNHAAEISAFVKMGYDVWSLEYRRGWHAGSYDSCLPRNPYASTEADFDRFDTAVVWAAQDCALGLSFIASLTTDSLLLYGTSFGGHLALMNGPFAPATAVANNRILGSVCVSGSVSQELTHNATVPFLCIHGDADSTNVADYGPLFMAPGAYARYAKGGRAVYQELSPYMPAWLIMHGGGHGKLPGEGSKIVKLIERSVIKRLITPGAYRATSSGFVQES